MKRFYRAAMTIIHATLGRRSLSAKNWPDAERHYRSAIKTNVAGAKSSHHAHLAMSYQQLKKLPKAVEHYRIALRLSPGKNSWRKRYVKCLIALKRYEDACRSLGALIRAEPENPIHYAQVGFCRTRQKTLLAKIKARRAYGKAMALDPNNHEYPLALGKLELETDNAAQAEATLRRSLAIRPTVEALTQLARALMKMKRYQEALDACEKARHLHSDGVSAGIITAEAEIYEAQQRWLDGIECWSRSAPPVSDEAALIRRARLLSLRAKSGESVSAYRMEMIDLLRESMKNPHQFQRVVKQIGPAPLLANYDDFKVLFHEELLSHFDLDGNLPAACSWFSGFPEALRSCLDATLYYDFGMSVFGALCLCMRRNEYRCDVSNHYRTIARELAGSLSEETLLCCIPDVIVCYWWTEDRNAAIKRLMLLILNRFDAISEEVWFRVARALTALGESALAWQILDMIVKKSANKSPTRTRENAAWMLNYLFYGRKDNENEKDKPAATIGILGYKDLSLGDINWPNKTRQSRNLGDYTQTLAVLGNLARFKNVDYIGESALPDCMETLKKRVPERYEMPTTAQTVRLLEMNRDGVSQHRYRKRIWLFVFGWHMNWFMLNGRFDFPHDDHIRPVFFAFHVNRQEMITPAAAAYLKRYGPIGCRDWQTVHILREYGVPAFFSGCVTTTLNMLFDKPPVPEIDKPLVIDYPDPEDSFTSENADFFSQYDAMISEAPMAENLLRSLDALELYRKYREVITSRLHAYMPSRTMGVPADFRCQHVSGKGRLPGLADVDDSGLVAMRDGLAHKIASFFSWLLEGLGEEEVYERWRSLCAAEVEEANAHCRKHVELKPTSIDYSGIIRRLKERSVTFNTATPEAIQVAMAVDANQSEYLETVFRSIVENTGRSVCLNLFTRELESSFVSALANTFPGAAFKWFDMSTVEYGDNIELFKRTTASTLDRIFLPSLLDGVEKVIYLDVDVAVVADLGELYDMEMGSAVFAGVTSLGRDEEHFYKFARMIENKLEANEANLLFQWLFTHGHAPGLNHPFLNAGVLLMRLAGIDKDDFIRTSLSLVEHYKMNDQDAINTFARGRVKIIDKRWNAMVNYAEVDDPYIIHWAGNPKPWNELGCAMRGIWQSISK